MMRRDLRNCASAAVVAAAALSAQPVAAQSIERIGDYSAWSAYTTSEDGNKVCFAASSPTNSEGNYTRRGDVFSIVTLRPADERDPEVSFIAGYTYQEDSTVEAVVDEEHSFALFTQGDAAWLPNDPSLDRQMIEQMQQGLTMVVQGTSARGTLTTDTYSLRGFTAAYNAMQQACS